MKGEVACLEGINLENFFKEYLIFMHGTIFLGVWCDLQVWNTLLGMEFRNGMKFMCESLAWNLGMDYGHGFLGWILGMDRYGTWA